MPVQLGPSLAGRLYDWTKAMVVLLYPDISNLTFENVKNVKCKIFLIDFLDELDRQFVAKKFLHFKNVILFILQQMTFQLPGIFSNLTAMSNCVKI